MTQQNHSVPLGRYSEDYVDNGDASITVVPDVSTGAGAVDAKTQRFTAASDGPLMVSLGGQADAAASTDTGSFSLLAFIKRILQGFTTLNNSISGVSTTGNITTNGQAVTLALSGQSGFLVSVAGTWTGTLQFEFSVDGGNTYTTLNLPTVNPIISSGVSGTTTTANTTRTGPCVGYTHVRVVATAAMTGTAVVTIRTSQGTNYLHALVLAGSRIAGLDARAASITQQPVLVGARCVTSAPTAVTNGQLVDPVATTQGVLITRPWQVPDLCWSYAAASGGITTTGDVPLANAAGTGIRRYITNISLSNNSATAVELSVKDGASTVIARFQLPANAANVNHRFDPPIATTANTALNVASSGTGAVFVNAQGFNAP